MKIFDNDDLGKLILRLMVGGLMLFHGISKLQNGVGFIAGKLEAIKLPPELAYAVYATEILAPILIIIGLQVRWAALSIVATMVGAIYLVHMGDIWTLTKTGAWGIELQMLFLMGALALVFMGSGKYAVRQKRF